MRKKILSAVLSMMMIATSVSPVFGAEFSSGEVDMEVSVEQSSSEQAIAFSTGNETEEVQFEDREGGYEDWSDGGDEKTFQADEDEFVYQAGVTNTASTPEEAELINLGQEYSGSVTKDSLYHWYKFVPRESGRYKIEAGSFNVDVENDEDAEYMELSENYEVYSENDLENYIYCGGEQYYGEGEMDNGVSLSSEKTYYIKFGIYSYNYDEIVPGSYRLQVNKIESEYVNTAPSHQSAEDIIIDQEYDGSVSWGEYHWYRFSPKKTGFYRLNTTVYAYDDEAYDDVECEYTIFSAADLQNSIASGIGSTYSLSLESGSIYYIGIALDGTGEKIPGSYKLKLSREMSTNDYIIELLEENGSLPALIETETGEMETDIVFNGGTDRSYMQFIPKRDGLYDIHIKEKGKENSDTWEPNIYDSQLSMGMYRYKEYTALEKGKVYYIEFQKEDGDPDNLVLVTKYFDRPAVSSLRVLSGPSRKEVYIGNVDFGYDLPGLPGLKLEVTYDNGEKEIMTTDRIDFFADMKETKYGYYIETTLNGAKFDNRFPAAGKYTATIKVGNESIQITDIIAKQINELPLLTGNGSLEVVSNSCGAAWIRFRAEKTGVHQLSNSTGRETAVYDESNNGVIDRWGYPGDLLSNGIETDKVTLQAGKIYYLEVSRVAGRGDTREDKITITVNGPGGALSKCKISMASSVAYTGKTLNPTIKILDGNKVLKKDTDYTVSYSKNKDIGTATATIKGKGSYTGTVKKTFKIVLGTPKLGKVTSAAYNKHKITWSKVTGATGYIVYQKVGNKWVEIKRTKGTSYVNTHSGKHPVLTGTTTTYTVKAYRTSGKKNIYSSYSKTGIKGKSALSKPAISKLSKMSKGLKLQWKAVSGASGYIIQRYDSGKWVTKKTITSAKTLTYTDTSAKKGKTYKYRIAAYRTVNKKKVLSTYSATKSGKR